MEPVSTIEINTLKKMIAGDEAAFAHIFHCYQPKLLAYCRKITKSETTAQEIVQDVFLRVWQYRKSINPQHSFDAYLFKITKNQVFNFLDKAARDRKIQSTLIAHFQRARATNSTENQLYSAEYERILGEAISQLPNRRQQVFRMSRMQGMTHAEIAGALDLSPGTVKIQIVRALKSIKEYLRIHSDIVPFSSLYNRRTRPIK